MTTQTAGPRALLIDLPGIDRALLHELVDNGELEHFSRLIEQGVSGRLQASPPLVSAQLWNTLVSGHWAGRHGVFARNRPVQDDVPAYLGAADRRAPTLWEIASGHELAATVVGGLTTLGDRTPNAAIVTEFFGAPQIPVTDQALAACFSSDDLRAALAEFWMRPDEVDGDMLRFFEPEAERVNQDRDPRLAVIGNALARLVSRHSALTWLMEHRPTPLMLASYSWLEDLLHVFIPTHVTNEDGNVLFRQTLVAAYRFFDMLLGRLLELAGPDCLLVLTSSAGVAMPTQEQLPQWAKLLPEQHRSRDGTFIAAGPGVKRDALLHGGRLVDVAPTILQVLGLPSTTDMPGRVLAEMFEQAPAPVKRVAADQMPVAKASVDVAVPVSDKSALGQYFRDLGLQPDAPRAPKSSGPATTMSPAEISWRWNRGRALHFSGRAAEALPDFERLCEEQPENRVFLQALIDCQLQLGLVREARDNIALLQEQFPDSPQSLMNLARAEFAAGRYDESLSVLETLEEKAPASNPMIDRLVGSACLRLRRWDDAIQRFARVLEQHPNDPVALRGQARAFVGQRDFEQAQDRALDAISREYNSAEAHYLLGISLLAQGRELEALVAFNVAAKLAPFWPKPSIQMLRIKRRHGASTEDLAAHRETIQKLREHRNDDTRLRRQIGARQQQRAEEKARMREAMLAQPPSFEMPTAAAPLVAMNMLAVCGLPGSGADALADVLTAGGIQRFGADDPQGRDAETILADLPTDPHLLDAALDQLISLPSTMLAYMPRLHHYRVVFVHRPIAEVLLLQRQAGSGTAQGISLEESARLLLHHRVGTISALRAAPNIDLLEIEYGELFSHPEAVLNSIQEFFGDDLLPDLDAMLDAVSQRTVAAGPDVSGLPETLHRPAYLHAS